VRTALVIDDDPIVRSVLSRTLEDVGWTVQQADAGDTGVELALKHRPEVIVTDLLMPRFNGYQVCRAIRSNQAYFPQPRIIVVSSSNYAADRSNSIDAGADDFLLKPIKPVELLRLLELEGGTTFIRRNPGPAKDATPPDTTFFRRAIGNPPTVRFWGVRGSIATPGDSTLKYGGNTTCIEVRADGELIVLDAGTGIRNLGRKLAAEFKSQPIEVSILISHTHWDHIQGFPFFIPAYSSQNQIRIMGYEGARVGLQSVLSSQMESPFFPVSMQQLPGYLQVEELKEMEFMIGQVKVRAAFMNHPGICVGYRLETSGGSIAFLPDNEPHSRLRMAPATESAQSYEVLAYAQKQDEKLIEFIRDCDVVIMDSQYDAAEYRTHIGWGHTCVDDAVALAVIAKVKQLFLFHHDPDHDDAKVDSMAEWARELAAIHGSNVVVEAAREGVEVVLNRAGKPG
jgi:phosphoribosyl 1,2-cyclic phosphodiesterase/ActR/RegA family two-component response regulator